MDIILRGYQERTVDQMVKVMKLEGNDIFALATGAGKSIVIANAVERIGVPTLIFQPSKEILQQNLGKLKLYVSPYDVGVYSASAGAKFVRKYTFATIGSVYKKPWLFVDFGLIMLDEAHLHNIKNSSSMYHSFITAVNKLRKERDLPPIKVIGLTATPYRNMTGYFRDGFGELFAATTIKLINRITMGKGKGAFWNRLYVMAEIGDLIRDGHLCPIEYEDREFLTQEQMKLNKSLSDFDLEDYAGKLGNRQQQLIECVQECEAKFKSVLVFCPSVATANRYAELVPGAASVSAKTPDDERDDIIRGFKNGRIKTVFNMNVLTIGFDHPALDCIILLRPTKSLALFYQMLGRGVRTYTSPEYKKEFCKVIDWTNTVKKLGKIETIQLRKEQVPEFKFPVWDIYSQTEKGEERWHNRELYTYAIKSKGRASFVKRNWAGGKW